MAKTKKIISLLLSVIMIMSVFTIVPFTAGAAEAEAAATAETDGDFEYIILEDNTAKVFKYQGENRDVNIPATLGGYTVTEIGGYAFGFNTVAVNVTIPQTVANISSDAFSSCENLETIYIPDSVTDIGSYAFANCKNLKSVTIPDSVSYLEYGLFSACTSLKSVQLPDRVKSISNYMFYKCTSLESFTVPDSVTEIGYAAFAGCTSLTNVNIPDAVTTIDYAAFQDCNQLKSIDIPASVETIEWSSFFHCFRLASISVSSDNTVFDSRDNCNAIIETATNKLITGCMNTVIPETVEIIGNSAFRDHKGLKEIEIPASTISIEANAFSGCTGLENISVSADNTVFDSRDNCNAIIETASNVLKYGCTYTVIPDTVICIGVNAFHDFTNLESISIPDSVVRVDNGAFYGCIEMKSVIIPVYVTNIGRMAFGYCLPEEGKGDAKIESFTIYGYEGSEAERYATNNGFTFIKLTEKTDEATGIILDISEDTDLVVKDITSEIVCDLPDGCNKMTAYDITLTKDGEAVQPDNTVTVKIPCANKNAKVYRFEADGTMTDMNAKYKDGYMVFTTDHFSVYVLVEPKSAGVTVSGTITSYVDDSDVTIKLTGADNNFTAEVKGKSDYSIEAVPAGEYTLTVSKANHVTREYTVTVSDTNVTQDVKVCPKGDVNGDGETDIMDCSVAQRYIRELTTLDAYQIACGDVSGEGDGELDIQDVSRILRHIRELAMLY